ncbi:MAG: DUF2975 domain-containing protein [Bifidobacteriaceae bacterium]|jgi:hypothetical protein|nr:DUF2975 domain-containing protein [Bifidobacteriaceae bacterium]
MRTRLLLFLIGLLAVILAPIQVLALPWMAAVVAESAPEFAALRWPLLALAEFMLIIADLFLLALGRLVAMAGRGVVFSRRAAFWVNQLIACLWVETAAIIPWLAVLGLVTHGPPGASAVCVVGLIAGTAAALVVSVMKALLVQATEQADELAEIV